MRFGCWPTWDRRRCLPVIARPTTQLPHVLLLPPESRRPSSTTTTISPSPILAGPRYRYAVQQRTSTGRAWVSNHHHSIAAHPTHLEGLPSKNTDFLHYFGDAQAQERMRKRRSGCASAEADAQAQGRMRKRRGRCASAGAARLVEGLVG